MPSKRVRTEDRRVRLMCIFFKKILPQKFLLQTILLWASSSKYSSSKDSSYISVTLPWKDSSSNYFLKRLFFGSLVGLLPSAETIDWRVIKQLRMSCRSIRRPNLGRYLNAISGAWTDSRGITLFARKLDVSSRNWTAECAVRRCVECCWNISKFLFSYIQTYFERLYSNAVVP